MFQIKLHKLFSLWNFSGASVSYISFLCVDNLYPWAMLIHTCSMAFFLRPVEGAGTLNQLKHILRAYCSGDWRECDQLVRKYSEKHEEIVFHRDSFSVRSRRDA